MVQKKSSAERDLKGDEKKAGKKPQSFEQPRGVKFSGDVLHGGEESREVVRGRIIGLLDDGFVVRGEHGVEDVFCEGDFCPGIAGSEKGSAVGDVVALRGARAPVQLADGNTVVRLCATEVRVLQKCETDFFLRPSDPNWLRGVVDQSVGENLRARAEVVKAVREFFERDGFLEVDTPSLVRLPGMEPYLDVFKTWVFAEKGGGGSQAEVTDEGDFIESEKREVRADGGEDMYLITSPEYAMKKLLVSGEQKIFQLAKVFRNNESGSGLHNPEFTLLEWYRAYSDYSKIMDDTEVLVRFVHEKIGGAGRLKWQGHEVDLGGPWPRKKVVELFEEYAGVQLEVFEDEGKLRAVAKEKGYAVESLKTYDDLFFVIFLNEIEPKLGFNKPVFVYDYPVSMGALARRCPNNPAYAERFELYIAGVEMCNGFSELCDAEEQKHRLERERKERKNLKKEDYGVDQSFLSALEFGMPPSGGNALGIDRLVMLMLDAPDIQSVMAFPHKDL